MTITLSSLALNTQTWAQTPSTADVSVTLDGAARTLTGMAAAAYLFGQALTTVQFQDTLDGVQLTDARFEFPPASGQRVPLAEVANALRYKYGVDPLIEFAPGLGVRGYSIPDINRILELLNREFAGQFSLTPLSSTAVLDATKASSGAAMTAAMGSFTGTVTTDQSIAFPTDPRWSTGTLVSVPVAGGGLNSAVSYYVRNLGSGNYSFFTSQAAAEGTGITDRVNLTPTASSVTVRYEGPTALNTDFSGASSTESVKFLNDPNWATGTRVRLSATYDGLTAGVDYFVRNLGNFRYSFFTSESAALGTGTTDRVDLASGLGRAKIVSDYSFTAASTLLNTASAPVLAGATDTELRQNLTEGGDLYTDRFGAFYLNGVRTQAMDVAVTSRLLVQDNVSAEYKLLMDELAERNNLIAAARTVLNAGLDGLGGAAKTLAEQYGMADVLGELTAGQYSDTQLPIAVISTDVVNKTVRFNTDPGWLTGTPVRFSTSGGGVTAGQIYYVRPDLSGGYSFYPSPAQANSVGSTPHPLTSSIAATVSRIEDPVSIGRSPVSVTGFSSIAPGGVYTDPYENYRAGYTEFSAPGSRWQTGDEIEPTKNIYGQEYVVTNYGTNTQILQPVVMSGENTYYLRKLSNGNFSIFDTRADAVGGGSTGQIYFINPISPAITPSQSDAAQFSPDPMWVSGTAVRANATGGGLTAGVDYFVRSLGLGNYSFFTTAAYATAPGNPAPTTGRVILSDPVTLTVNSVADLSRIDAADFTTLTALLNTLISNKVRDGDLDQAKLQTLTAQLQNNTEAMTALIKAFTEMNAQLAQALR